MTQEQEFYTSFILIALAFVFYFVPTICASIRGHKNENPIQVVNLLLGWTILGWIVALMWSLTDNVKNKEDQTL